MSEDRNSYRNITKSIGIFGGTKVFQILVGLIRNKIVAVLLGPVGMGIQGMLLTTVSLVEAFTGLGLHTSAVRDVAKAHASGDKDRIDTTVSILRKLVVITGLLGSLLVLVFASQLSQWSFGNEDYTLSFRLIAIVLFIDQIVIGQNVLLQGTFHYKYMAAASMWGGGVGLVISAPLYFIWGMEAIVPVIIITSVANLVIVIYYSQKVPYDKKHLSWSEFWTGGKVMVTLGLAIAMASAVGNGKTYLVRAFITNYGSLEAVGLYTAGAAFVTQYINVIFQAMGSDYSPRLAAVSDDNKKFIEVMNRQAILLVTLVAPLVMIFIVFVKQLIIILYSSKFLPIIGMIEWMMAGMLFRAVSWAMSYSFAAHGESKAFFVNELLSAIYSFTLTILGYKLLSYDGIGIGFCLTYVFYTIQVYIITHIRFGFHFNKETKVKCFPMIALCFLFIGVLKAIDDPMIKILLGFVFTVIVSFISYKLLDQMIGIKSVLEGIKLKFIKKK